MVEMKSTIFRAYDIRGQYQKDIDQSIFYQIGCATGTYLQTMMNGKTLTVGNDIRRTSESLASAFIAGVSSTGVDVLNTGTSSFGQTLYYGWNQHHDLISFITASHLPADWNGVKLYYGDGVGLPKDELNIIRNLSLQQEFNHASWQDIGQVQIQNPKKIYQEFFLKQFKYSKNLRVAIDCGGGSMTLSTPDLFSLLDLTVIPVYCDPDPLFSVRPSDPKPENLSTLVETVKNSDCDFGVAFDGDGDRAVIVDEKGSVLSAEQTGIIIGKYGLEEKKGTVIVNVECSKAVDEQLTPLGYSIKHIPVGHTYLTLHAKKENSPLGIESSGHLILPQYVLFDDAIIIPLKIAEILEQTSLPLSGLKDEIPMYPRNKVEISCSDEKKFMVIDTLKEDLAKKYDQVNTLDGIRVDLEEGWILIRASNTGPLIRLTVEADTSNKIEEITRMFKSRVEYLIEIT